MFNMSAFAFSKERIGAGVAALMIMCGFLGGSLAFAEPVTLNLFELQNAPELKSKQGFLLIDLDIEGNSPSLHFARVSSKSTQGWLTPEQSTKQRSKQLKLDFSGMENGITIRPLQAGIYQITRVNAPYYDFPFWMDTDGQRIWRFNIEPGKINYIGKLNISGERSTNSVDIRLLNRFATDFQRINEELIEFPYELPLVLSRGVQDHFDAYLAGEQ